jgi:hypothetical protein
MDTCLEGSICLAGPILCLKGGSNTYVIVNPFNDQANLEVSGPNWEDSVTAKVIKYTTRQNKEALFLKTNLSQTSSPIFHHK